MYLIRQWFYDSSSALINTYIHIFISSESSNYRMRTILRKIRNFTCTCVSSTENVPKLRNPPVIDKYHIHFANEIMKHCATKTFKTYVWNVRVETGDLSTWPKQGQRDKDRAGRGTHRSQRKSSRDAPNCIRGSMQLEKESWHQY